MKRELVDVTKKSGFVFTGRIVGKLISFPSLIVITRLLGAEIYGEFVYIRNIVELIAFFTFLGIGDGIVAFIPKLSLNEKKREIGSLVSFSFLITLAISTILTFTIMISHRYVARFVLRNQELSTLLLVLAPLLLFNTFNNVSTGVFRGLQRAKPFVISGDIIVPAVFIVMFLILFYLGLRIYGLVIAAYTSMMASFIYRVYHLEKLNVFERIERDNVPLYRETLRFSLPLFLRGFLAIILQRTDRYMIGYYLNTKDVGVYDVALKIGTWSSIVLSSFNTMFGPMISRLYHGGELKKLEQMYKVITRWVVMSNLIAFSLIVIFRQELLQLFGKDFVLGETALLLVAIGQIVNSGVGSAGTINIMSGHPEYALYVNILAAALNIFLNILLIPRLGINGAAIATLVSLAAANITRLVMVYRNLHIHPYDSKYLKVFLCVGVAFLVVFFLNSIFHYHWIAQLISLSFLFLVIYGLGHYLMGFTDEDRMIVRFILSKLKQK
jgi:O-antigen/teichoic acid export membrane protein